MQECMEVKVAEKRSIIQRGKLEAHLNLCIHYLIQDNELQKATQLEEAIGLAFVDFEAIKNSELLEEEPDFFMQHSPKQKHSLLNLLDENREDNDDD